jgi:hypothetical protein
MWTTLSLLVMVASTAVTTPPVELTPGTRIRLGAGPAVHVPGLFSGTETSYEGTRLVERRDGLFLFRAGDGEPEAVLVPKATVEGTLVGADPVYIYLRLADRGITERIRRASVARVHAVLGTKHLAGRGAVAGSLAGAALGIGSYLALSRPGTDWPTTPEGTALMALVGAGAGLGVGAAVGALCSGDDWQEVPLEALPGRPEMPPPSAGPRGADDLDAADVAWEGVSKKGSPGLTPSLRPRSDRPAAEGSPKAQGPLRETLAALGTPAWRGK